MHHDSATPRSPTPAPPSTSQVALMLHFNNSPITSRERTEDAGVIGVLLQCQEIPAVYDLIYLQCSSSRPPTLNLGAQLTTHSDLREHETHLILVLLLAGYASSRSPHP